MAIIETAKKFGVNITLEEISIEKKKGNANNDWILSKRLIESKRLVAAGKNSKVPIEEVSFEVSLEEVTQVFEEIYQGTLEKPGLCETESLIPSRGFLEEIKRRCHGKIAVVTGRPRKDCQKFLVQHNINDLFDVQICMEDGPCKPSPIPVQLACKQLNVEPSESIMIGDTPDDIIAGVTAGATSWGVFTPEEDARITLGLISLKESMYDYLTKSGAVGVMKPGMLQMLDIIPSIDPITIFKKVK
jgi:HAD superfamily hydrolase (TIGR01548 family)